MLIYKATNTLNGKSYIGKTVKTLESRKIRHKREAEKDYYVNSLFHRAIRKHGFDVFQWQILIECIDEVDLNYMETFMIASHCTHMNNGGYNMTWGGTGGDTWSGCLNREERARKVSEANKGKKRTPEQNKRQSEIRTGEKRPPFSLITRMRMSESRKGRVVSDETRIKIGNSRRGKKMPVEAVRKSAEANTKYGDEVLSEIIRLREEEKMSIRKIAKKMAMPHPSVNWCIKRWRSKNDKSPT